MKNSLPTGWKSRTIRPLPAQENLSLFCLVTVFLLLILVALAIGVLIDENAKSPIQTETKKSAIQVAVASEPTPEIRVETAVVSAYSAIESCHNPNCAMASGKRAYVGAAACPRAIPLGTHVIIQNTELICEDRTSQTYDGRYDIFMGYEQESYTRALEWGVQTLSVQIL